MLKLGKAVLTSELCEVHNQAEKLEDFVIKTAEDLVREIGRIKKAGLSLSLENELINKRTVFLYRYDKAEYLRFSKLDPEVIKNIWTIKLYKK